MTEIRLTLLQKIRAFFYPLLVRRTSSKLNPVLELYYYRGRFQLATSDALYSDGKHYRPLVAACDALAATLPLVKQVLVLGTGLGSAVQVLRARGCTPAFTLVDLDAQVLDWAMELMPGYPGKNITPVCADAASFLDDHAGNYDLIIVDVFEGRFVPPFVLAPSFLAQCRQHLAPGGHLVLNYMIGREQTEEKAKAALGAAFGVVKALGFHLNRVFVAKA